MEKDINIVFDNSTATYQDDFKHFIKDKLILTIEDIDDLAVAWIVKIDDNNNINFYCINDSVIKNEKSIELNKLVTHEKPKWLWRPGGNHGGGSENITQWFHENNEYILDSNGNFEGYLVISIYDFPYTSKLLPGGKWSFSAKLEKNGEIIWQNNMFRQSEYNNRGIQYLKIFSIIKNNHKFEIYETIQDTVKNKIYCNILKNYNYTDFKKNNNLKNYMGKIIKTYKEDSK